MVHKGGIHTYSTAKAKRPAFRAKPKQVIGVELRYRTWVPVVVFDTPAYNGWKSNWGGPIFEKNTRGVVLVAPEPKWGALLVIPAGIILIPEVSF